MAAHPHRAHRRRLTRRARALSRVDLDDRGRRAAGAGRPSGCGKCTALRIVAGLEPPTAGHDRASASATSPRCRRSERDIAMVFQSYALYPHKTVRENLAFGLRMRGVAARRDRRARVASRRASRARPAARSQARAALGRPAPARRARPRASCARRRCSCSTSRCRTSTPSCASQMRAELARLHRRLGTTMLYVTHDQEEAMTLGRPHRRARRRAAIEQLAPPLEIYRRPANRSSPSSSACRASTGSKVSCKAIAFTERTSIPCPGADL